MRLLLDTHALFWVLKAPERLRPAVLDIVADETVDAFVSAVSAYELSLKVRQGRLPDVDIDEFAGAVRDSRFLIADVTLDDAIRAGALPLTHRDPWDRLIAAQALRRGLTVVTRDPAFARYGVPVLW